jgi:uncharacterized protein
MAPSKENLAETLQKHRLAENHFFRMAGHAIFYDVHRMGVYGIHDEPARDLIDFFNQGRQRRKLDRIIELHGVRKTRNAFLSLKQSGLLASSEPESKQTRNAFLSLKQSGLLASSEPESKQGPLKPASCHADRYLYTLVVNLCHDCNFRCSYCFANQGLYRNDRRFMDWKTAKAAVDFLVGKANPQMKEKRLQLELFGGEPLMNMPVIRKLVDYREEVKAKTGFEIGISLPTNGLLLTKRILDFCDRHQIGVQVSIDGPPEIQDRYRKLTGGEGSYGAIIGNVRRLIERRRTINARATIGRNDVHMLPVAKHLIDEVGFSSVFIAESTGVEGCSGTASNTTADLREISNQLFDVAEEYVSRARGGRVFNVSPFAHAVSTLWNPTIKTDACGAGKGYLTVAVDGSIYPCMRFVDLEAYRLGNVFDGELNEDTRDMFYHNTVDSKEDCGRCWARYLCGGACVFLPVEYHGSLDKQPLEICDTYRRRYECAMYAMSVLNSEGFQLKNNHYVKAAT